MNLYSFQESLEMFLEFSVCFTRSSSLFHCGVWESGSSEAVKLLYPEQHPRAAVGPVPQCIFALLELKSHSVCLVSAANLLTGDGGHMLGET